MLVQLSIRNLAIVDTLDVEFGPGATALTGETGAGKSMLVDALSLISGGRASSAAVRPGCERAEITAVFEVGGVPEVEQALRDLEIEDSEGQCVLRRIVGADGRSRAFVNTTPVSAGTLRELGDRLLDIHGQHSHHALLRRDEQRRLLDEFARHDDLLKSTAALSREIAQLSEQIETSLGGGEDPAARLDYLRFQLDELDSLGLTAASLAQLNEEHSRLGHASELRGFTESALRALDDEDGECARSNLASALRAVRDIQRFDTSVVGAETLLKQASIDLDEAIAQIRAYGDRLDVDPASLQRLERQLSAVHDLARKHRVEPESLPQLQQQLRIEADLLASRGERLAELEAAREALLKQYRDAADLLSKSRVKAAKRLSRDVSQNMQQLGMTGARFEVAINPEESRAPSPRGLDSIEFLVAANPGLPMQPVARTASGGELSRISLAIQVVDVSGTGVPTVIFDEVDVGVGGRHADVVGRMLRTLSENRQTLCVTHQPQVASRAHHHLRILKTSAANSTTTAVEYLHGEQRVEEIARMLGGVELTRQTVAHAREMIQRS